MSERKNHQEQENIYFMAEGEEDGKPLIFRSLHHIPSGIIESDYPNLVTISWYYEPENESGMPDTETNNIQIELEEALEALDSPGVSLLMLVVTGNGRKEWHWYVLDVDAWINKLNELLADYPPFPIQIENHYQPDWALYHTFISGVEGIQ